MSLTCLCQTDSFIFVVFQKLDHSDVSKNRFAQIRIWWRQYWEEDNIVWRQTHLCMKELVAIFCRNVWLISECGRAHTACMCTCACSCSGVLFRYCRKHPTDDCHSQRNGGRRKQWCDWVIFSWTACSQASWIILKTLQERHFLCRKQASSSFTRAVLLCGQVFPHLQLLQTTRQVCV